MSSPNTPLKITNAEQPLPDVEQFQKFMALYNQMPQNNQGLLIEKLTSAVSQNARPITYWSLQDQLRADVLTTPFPQSTQEMLQIMVRNEHGPLHAKALATVKTRRAWLEQSSKYLQPEVADFICLGWLQLMSIEDTAHAATRKKGPRRPFNHNGGGANDHGGNSFKNNDKNSALSTSQVKRLMNS